MATRRKPGFSVEPRDKNVWADALWRVWRGELRRRPGRPNESLFTAVAEKLPFGSIRTVEKMMKDRRLPRTGVYVAHDSMGTARYVGRGRIFARLKARHKKYPLVLLYYSFYVVPHKSHEREVETLLIRAAGPLLEFNERKKRLTISTGSIRDYEAGTVYFQRRPRRRAAKGRRRKKRAA